MPGFLNAAVSPLRMRRPDSRRNVSRSATRALDVLEFFGQTRRPCRAVEIARALDMHPSTTNQLLKTLVDSAHLTFDGRSKTYLPSPRLTDFSAWVVANYGASDRLHLLLRDIHSSTGAIVTLTTPNDLFMQVIDTVGSAEWARSAHRGLHVSVFGSGAVGNAYLSAIPDREIERLSERARLPERTLKTLRETILRVRSVGFAESMTADGALRSLAIPLPKTNPLPMVVAIADRAERMERDGDDLRGKMREAIGRWIPAKQLTARQSDEC
jgi:DNA-binding IclR family transcriptional regulator